MAMVGDPVGERPGTGAPYERDRVPMLARILGGVGRTLITAGVLILLFVAYQLWGTGVRTAQAQDGLEDDLAALEEQADAALGPADSEGRRLPINVGGALPSELLPVSGEAAGRIEIDEIGIDWVFVEGVSVNDLKKGPGHYPQTPLPGQAGNAGLAGHRTTYGAPFANIDALEPGDEITITTVQGTFTYAVRGQEIVSPSAIEVLENGHWSLDGRVVANTLTLTACHPRYSAAERIIVWAELIGNPAPETPRPEGTPNSIDEPGAKASNWPAIFWGLVCAVIWAAAWAIGRRYRTLKWPSYAVGTLPFLVALFFFFENFSRLLPSNY